MCLTALVREITNANFGLVIAYVLPGFTALIGVSFFTPAVYDWLHGDLGGGPTLGGFLYVTLASVAAGLMASTLRWLIIDAFHHRTGIPRFNWNFAALHERLAAFELLVEAHYRYYQFYGNSMIAAAFSFGAYHVVNGWRSWWTVVAFTGAEILLWLGSRSTIRNYALRGAMLLGEKPRLVYPIGPEH